MEAMNLVDMVESEISISGPLGQPFLTKEAKEAEAKVAREAAAAAQAASAFFLCRRGA